MQYHNLRTTRRGLRRSASTRRTGHRLFTFALISVLLLCPSNRVTGVNDTALKLAIPDSRAVSLTALSVSSLLSNPPDGPTIMALAILASLARTRRLRTLVSFTGLCIVHFTAIRIFTPSSAKMEHRHVMAQSRLIRRQAEGRIEADMATSDKQCHAFLLSGLQTPGTSTIEPEPHELFVPNATNLTSSKSVTLFPGPSQIVLAPKELSVLNGIVVRPQSGAKGDWHYPASEPIPSRRIFFISFNSQFRDASYLCAVEAAALLNPLHSIQVYTPNVTDLLAVMQHEWGGKSPHLLTRVQPRHISYWEAFETTPFQLWYENGTYAESKWVKQNLGNALRLAILWKEGGQYLDLDVLSISSNPFGKASRAVAMQDEVTVNNAALTFPPHDPFVWAAMKAFVSDFQGGTWSVVEVVHV